ncbi:MAG: hypothetical protein J0L96_00285 [Anaerolineae bacterium]|nr:hypothetical protein [Anaerolineae bacterium]
MTTPTRSVFIVWKEYQRRVEVMAPYLGAECFYFHYSWEERSKFFKALSYILKTFNTLKCLLENKPSIILVQFPPAPPLYAVALYAWLSGAKYVSDCHLGVTNARWLGWPLVKKLLAGGVVIVHNEHLVEQTEAELQLKAFVLRDGIVAKQSHEVGSNALLKDLGLYPNTYVIFPCSFSADEPIQEMIDAARLLPEIKFVMTWYVEKLAKQIRDSLPPNVTLTGFLKTDDFNCLFANAGAALVLTKYENVQLSGMQEAMAFGIPAVVTDLRTTRFLYKNYPVYVDNTVASIMQGIKLALQHRINLEQQMNLLRIESEKEFIDQMATLKSALGMREEKS